MFLFEQTMRQDRWIEDYNYFDDDNYEDNDDLPDTFVTVSVLFGDGFTDLSVELPHLDSSGAEGFFLLIRLESDQDTLHHVRPSGIGDFNGDGVDDIAVFFASRPDTRWLQTVYVVFGRKKGEAQFPKLMSVDELMDGKAGLQILMPDIKHIQTEAGPQGNVTSLGDVNGDAISDFGVYSNGTGYVLFGSRKKFNARFHISTLDGANNGFIMTDDHLPRDQGLYQLVGAGDINADGLADIIIFTQRSAKKLYVLLGQAQPFPRIVNIGSTQVKNKFELRFPSALKPLSAVGIGDFNGDGTDDILTSEQFYSGLMYFFIFLGHRLTQSGSYPEKIELSPDSNSSFLLTFRCNGDGIFFNNAGLGDVNGDGFSDVFMSCRVSGHPPLNTIVYGHTSGDTHPHSSTKQHAPLTTADIVGIACGASAFLASVVGIAYCRRKRLSKSAETPTEDEPSIQFTQNDIESSEAAQSGYSKLTGEETSNIRSSQYNKKTGHSMFNKSRLPVAFTTASKWDAQVPLLDQTGDETNEDSH
eukprot:gb/GECG01011428.1/.p1 GENE.gb/GECG01011428.1/~~gb/GECG01011428.1/.p1  ORF type:complete len:529 (+),score=61.48 gb/GECG01011428.1/:1-1587(+)